MVYRQITNDHNTTAPEYGSQYVNRQGGKLADGDGTTYFPIAYPNAPLEIVYSFRDWASSTNMAEWTLAHWDITKSGFGSHSTSHTRYLSVGY